MTTTLSCHQCKSELSYLYSGSVAIVCSKCGNINRSGGTANDYIIPFNFPPEDMTPLRIGTEGKSDNKKFTITGRVRYDFSNAYRNQWSVLFENGNRKWLSECYGYYALYEKSKLNIPSSELKNLIAGDEVELPGSKIYCVETIRRNGKFTGEGELHEFVSVPFNHFQIELSNDTGEILVVNILSQNNYDIFQGLYYEFKDLDFKNCRQDKVWM